MFGFVLPGIVQRLLPYVLGIAFVLLVGWWIHRVANSWCNGACQEAREEVVQLTQERDGLLAGIKAAQDRASALAVLWAEAIQKVEVRYVEAKREQSKVFAGLRERAGRIRLAPAGTPLVVPADVGGLLADAHRGANGGEDTAPAGGDSQAAAPVPETAGGAVDTTLAEWAQFAVEAAEAYADARSKHLACVAWAGSITQGADHERTPPKEAAVQP